MLNYRLCVGKLGRRQGLVALMLMFSAAVAGIDSDRMLLLAGQRYGDVGTASVSAWRDLLNQSVGQAEQAKLRRVNEFFNRRVRFEEDSVVWGKPDYWATPLEVLGRGQGDCEDFAIAKYVTLKLLGVAPDKLRLVYVKARIGGAQSSLVQAHMVLSYYPAPEEEPLVLDNLITDVRPASRRPDLTTIFSFNAEGIWAGGGASRATAGAQRLSKWQSVIARMRDEGID